MIYHFICSSCEPGCHLYLYDDDNSLVSRWVEPDDCPFGNRKPKPVWKKEKIKKKSKETWSKDKVE